MTATANSIISDGLISKLSIDAPNCNIVGNQGQAPDPGVPSLALDFGQSGALDPFSSPPSGITFTRADTASAATYFGSDGLLKVADRNLLTYSEQFDNAAWTKSNSFVQTNLLTYSQEFDNAAWSPGSSTVLANAIAEIGRVHV